MKYGIEMIFSYQNSVISLLINVFKVSIKMLLKIFNFISEIPNIYGSKSHQLEIKYVTFIT